MLRADRLLHFISQLQTEDHPLQRRQLLLHYIRKLTDADLVAVFVLDKRLQQLVLLSYSDLLSATTTNPSLDSLPSVPLTGIFGSALSSQGLLLFPDLSLEKRALAEELAWAPPGTRVVLSTVRENSLPSSELGLLVLTFASPKNSVPDPIAYEGDLLICAALLSSYLSLPEEEPVPHRLRHELPAAYDELDRAVALLLRNRRAEQRGTLPELLYSLSSISDLYELGLLIGSDISLPELYQHILSSLGRVILAHSSCLLFFEPAYKHFIPVASQGTELSYDILARSLDSREMERLALRGPGETIAPILLGDQRLLLVTLSCNCSLLAIVALAVTESDSLLDERSLLLSYMGNVAALILKNHELHLLALQDFVEQERNRIARDIHDGSVQNIGYVLRWLASLHDRLALQPAPSLPDKDLLAELAHATQILDQGLQGLRHDLSSLLPLELEEQDFSAALEHLITDFKHNEPALLLSYHAELPVIQSSTLQTAIFRCVQEALNNIRKHAHARSASVRLSLDQNELVVEVQDDGVGFHYDLAASHLASDASSSPDSDGRVLSQIQTDSKQHFGLRSMLDRAKSVGGSVELLTHPGSGTLLKARFPLTSPPILLTTRERDVLRLINEGLSNAQIALKLSISRETVKSHIHHIMQKLQVHDRTLAATTAVRQGLL
jgi:signal transduction histidine kinase